MKHIFLKLLESTNKGAPAVMYTLVDTGSHEELEQGARMLVCEEGEVYGTLGTKSLDEQVVGRAKEILQHSVPTTGIVELSPSPAKAAVKVLEDSYFPDKKLVVFGGGHVAQPLVEIASILGYRPVVIDDRPDFANRERFPRAEEVLCASFEEVLDHQFIEQKIDRLTSVVIITRGHTYDKNCLTAVIHSPARYIGMIGSKVKVRKTFQALLNEGVDKKLLQRVSAPIGLNLGGQRPEEIALSIVAEMVARENGGSGLPLKEIKGGIWE